MIVACKVDIKSSVTIVSSVTIQVVGESAVTGVESAVINADDSIVSKNRSDTWKTETYLVDETEMKNKFRIVL